jgi:hypothetical protein
MDVVALRRKESKGSQKADLIMRETRVWSMIRDGSQKHDAIVVEESQLESTRS